MPRTHSHLVRHVAWGLAYVLTFLVVFTGAAGASLAKGGVGGTLTLQQSGDNKELLEHARTSTVQVPYIARDGEVARRPVVLHQPADATTRTPLVYVPHYAIDDNAAELGDYLRAGWAVASPTEFDNSYNTELLDDDLVFNNAALHMLRNRSDIDPDRIALVGGSAGGFTTLMLGASHLGIAAAVAHSPITNPRFNFEQYFQRVIQANLAALDDQEKSTWESLQHPDSGGPNPLRLLVWARMKSMPFPLLATLTPQFAAIAERVPQDHRTDRWAALSPSANAHNLSSPVVITHNTADMLVPVEQVSRRLAPTTMGPSVPDGFTNRMEQEDSLDRPLEETADPAATRVNRVSLPSPQTGQVDMPFDAATRLTIDVYDDGTPNRNDTHASVHNATATSPMAFLHAHLDKGLAHSEQLTPSKALLLLQRYRGESLALPAHTGVDDTAYGSLAVYQQEVVEELDRWVDYNSLAKLDQVMASGLTTLDAQERTKAQHAWAALRALLTR